VAGETTPLLFSTNRTSAGQNFDFLCKYLSITFDYRKDKLHVAEFTFYQSDFFYRHLNLISATAKVNSFADQLGPYLIPGKYIEAKKYNDSYQSYIFLYSSNEEGNQDIRFTHNFYTKEYTLPKTISFLNSAQNDAYPFITQDSSSLYFCSDREGNFDIYSVNLNTNKGIVAELESSTPRPISKESILSSESDDKCPFISGHVMIFTSNRPGGFGGYDLYYSIFENGTWSAPVNFGPRINSSSDEYRPVLKSIDSRDFTDVFTNDFMIFSSNRPGGKGGFDLYYVGVPKLNEGSVSF